MSALYRRAMTGQGVWIDLAMYQNGVSYFGEGLLDFAFNGRRARRMGNRHESRSPHGCYPCRSDDRWVVLSVRDERGWRELCDAMGQPDLATDPRFADPVVRHRNQDELDSLISQWCAERTQDEVVAELYSRGVPAAPVLDAGQLLADPHLRERGLFEQVEHPGESGLGKREYLGRGWRLSGSDVRIRGAAPDMGEANEFILHDMLGLEPHEIAQLKNEEAIGEELAGAATPNVVSLERQVELGWIVRFEEGERADTT